MSTHSTLGTSDTTFGRSKLSFRLVDRNDEVIAIRADEGFCQCGDTLPILPELLGDRRKFGVR